MNDLDKFLSCVSVILLLFLIILGIDAVDNNMNTETTIIEQKIVDVDTSNDDYMTLYLENGKQYKIKPEIKQYDFTNSKLKIKLHRSHSFLRSNPENIWYIDNMVKFE